MVFEYFLEIDVNLKKIVLILLKFSGLDRIIDHTSSWKCNDL